MRFKSNKVNTVSLNSKNCLLKKRIKDKRYKIKFNINSISDKIITNLEHKTNLRSFKYH